MIMKVAQAASYLGISASTVYALVASKRIAHLRVGNGRGGIRFTDEQLQGYLSACVVEPAGASIVVARRLKHLRLNHP